MKKRALTGLLMFIIALFTITGCKSSGGDVTHTQPTTATLKIISSGTLTTGTQIGGVDVTVNLPSGVTVQATADSINPAVMVMDPGVVLASGVAAGANTLTSDSIYTAATGTWPGKVRVLVINGMTGFGTGEFVTVNCKVADGVFPTAADFNLTNFTAKDLASGATITVLTAGFTADIK
jgi:hypothetical protein